MHPIPPSEDAITDQRTLPCGCVIGSYGDAMVIIPCDYTCANYQYTLSESARQAKPILFDSDVDNA